MGLPGLPKKRLQGYTTTTRKVVEGSKLGIATLLKSRRGQVPLHAEIMLKWVAMRSPRLPVKLVGMPGQWTTGHDKELRHQHGSRTLRLMECMEQGMTIGADVDNQTGHLFEAYKAHAQKLQHNRGRQERGRLRATTKHEPPAMHGWRVHVQQGLCSSANVTRAFQLHHMRRASDQKLAHMCVVPHVSDPGNSACTLSFSVVRP